MAGPGLRFDKVSVRLGGTEILSNVSFDVAPSSIHCITGPNGGGKTTLMRALLGQVPFDGTITMEGPAKPVIGYAPQSLDIDRNLPFTVEDVLAVMLQRRPAFMGRSASLKRHQDALLARLGLGAKARRLFGHLSGGERQRLLFAQALLPAPDVLLIDEATANMDEDGVRLIEEMVRELSASGVTVLWINHDAAQVNRMADRVTEIARKVLSDRAANASRVLEPSA